MASKTEIANRALIKLGQPRVSNIETDSSAPAVTLNQIYNSVLQTCLQTYPWNFSIKRTDLAPDANAPSWGFDYAFTLPTDCLQLLEVKDDIEFRVEGRKILCDGESVLYIKYVANITDTSLFPPVFVEFLSQQLAIEASDRIADDDNLKANLMSQMAGVMQRAMATNAIENRPVELDNDDWLLSRL
jgi:hypothetical protein